MGIRDIAARWLAPRGPRAPRSNRRRPPAWLVLLLALGALSIHVVTAPPGATAAAAPEPARGPAADAASPAPGAYGGGGPDASPREARPQAGHTFLRSTPGATPVDQVSDGRPS